MQRSFRACAALVGLGVALRAGLLAAAPELRLVGDESSYAYLALAWNRFGFLPDSVDYLWPPGYPAVLALGFRSFGPNGLWVVKCLQVLASAVVGGSLSLLAFRLFGARASVVCAGLWAIHLPLAVYVPAPRPETLGLALTVPAVVLLHRALTSPTEPASWWRLAATGLLLGVALMLRQTALLLLIVALGFVALAPGQGRARERGLRGSILLLAAMACALPWTLRNLDLYDRVVVGGATLGRNLHHGMNGYYRNFDYQALDLRLDELYGADDWFYHGFVLEEEPRIWETSRAPNVLDRDRENRSRALAWALEDPGFFLRSRIKKLADFATPLSFAVTYQARPFYDESALAGRARYASVPLALTTSALVLLGGIPGLFLALRSSVDRALMGSVVLAAIATAPIVAMSRYRVPAEPFLLVLSAGALAAPLSSLRWKSGWGAAAGAGLLLLLGLWWLNAREIAAVVSRALA